MSIRSDGTCEVCGGRSLVDRAVLWPALVEAWQLTAAEVALVDVQQGTHCTACGANVRSIALARAIMRWAAGGLGVPVATFAAFVEFPAVASLRVLEINHAGTLYPYLARLPRHQLVLYPEHDMMRLTFADSSHDLIVHSDTLEHVSDPVQGLRECYRVLAPGGAVVFTVPILPARLTRNRRGLPPSYHGQESTDESALLVHTEFGADAWTMVLEAGFSSCEVVPFRYPSGLALIARR